MLDFIKQARFKETIRFGYGCLDMGYPSRDARQTNPEFLNEATASLKICRSTWPPR